MNIPDEFTVPQAASCLSVSEETVRRNIRSKRLKALRRGTQWFIRRDVPPRLRQQLRPQDWSDTTRLSNCKELTLHRRMYGN